MQPSSRPHLRSGISPLKQALLFLLYGGNSLTMIPCINCMTTALTDALISISSPYGYQGMNPIFNRGPWLIEAFPGLEMQKVPTTFTKHITVLCS